MASSVTAGACIFAAEGTAQAQVATDWELTGTLIVGATNNSNGAAEPADDAPEDTQRPEADGFVTLTPAIRFQFETPSATHTLSYGLGYTLFFIHTETSTFSQGLSYGVRAPVSEGVDLSFGITGSQSTTSQFALLSTSSTNTVNPTQQGDDILLTVGGGQGLNAQVGQTTFFRQALAASFAQTITSGAEGEEDPADTRTVTGSFSLGVGREFARDTLAFDQSNDLQYSPGVDGVAALPDSLQLIHRARLDWTHTFNLELSTQLGGGVLMGYDAITPAAPEVQPTGSASIRWAPPRGNLSLSYSHDATPNILLRQVTLNDTGTFAGLVNLSNGFDVGGSAAVQVSRSLLGAEDGGLGEPGFSTLIDLALGWIPPNGPLRVEARYQFSRQFGLNTDPEADEELFPTIQRHTGLLTTTFAFPRAPAPGGVGRGIALPSPTANVDVISNQAPPSQRAVQEAADKEKKDDKEKKEEKRDAE